MYTVAANWNYDEYDEEFKQWKIKHQEDSFSINEMTDTTFNSDISSDEIKAIFQQWKNWSPSPTKLLDTITNPQKITSKVSNLSHVYFTKYRRKVYFLTSGKELKS